VTLELTPDGLPIFPATLWGLLAERAEETPDQVILEDDGGRTLTAQQWQDSAESVAAALHAQGVKEGMPVSWQLPTILESAVLMLALTRLGAVSNPIIPILRQREVSFITAQTNAELLITPSVWRNFDYAAMASEVAAQLGCATMVIERDQLPSGDPSTLPPVPSGEGNPVRHIYYSSGTTADPKGCKHTDASAMASARGTVLMGLDPTDVVSLPFPYTHIGGIAITCAALHRACRIVFIEAFDPVKSPLALAERGATKLGSAVPFFHAYRDAQLRHGPEPLFPRLRAFNSGGAPKPPELYFELKELFGVPMLSSWGLTEFPIITFSVKEDSDEDLSLTEGRVVPGVDLRVVSAEGVDLPPGQEGELLARGPQSIVGYVDGRLDADAFDSQGFFRTGDLGVVGPRGHVRITGRLKDVIIRNAENISAQEIEGVLYTHPKVGDVAVIGVPDARTGERACAVVVLAEGVETVTLAELIEYCRAQQLAVQKIPERLEIIDVLPRNSMGKILKQDLRKTFG
jgi:acyl-CoA synthetase (AMP-forming)/AMP-acid ligase II